MDKLDAIAAILGLGLVGGALYMFATKKWRLPSLPEFISPLTGVSEQIRGVTGEIEETTAQVKDITLQIKEMEEALREKMAGLTEQVERVQVLAERSVAREELYATAYEQALEREHAAAVERIPEESALTILAVKQPHTLEWLRRTMPYAVPY